MGGERMPVGHGRPVGVRGLSICGVARPLDSDPEVTDVAGLNDWLGQGFTEGA